MHVKSFGNARSIYNEQQITGYDIKSICQIMFTGFLLRRIHGRRDCQLAILLQSYINFCSVIFFSFCTDIQTGTHTNTKTRCSAIAERPRCRVRYSFAQKWKTETGRQYLRTLQVYLQPLWYNRPENLSNSVKKRKIRAITAFIIIQGHRGRYQ